MVAGPLKRHALRALPAQSIIDTIAEAAHAWTDRALPARVDAVASIASRTGYSRPVVEFALDQLFGPITPNALRATITAEIGSVEVLDRFISQPSRPDVYASPIGNVCIIASRTTIGVALLPAIYAICAKCDVTVKDREDQLIGAFFRTLADRDDAFAHAARAQAFSSTDEAAIDVSEFQCIVAFGKNKTLSRIRGACASEARFVGFGTRASVGYICNETAQDSKALARTVAGAACDLVLYDSEGCMSLHVLFVESPVNLESVAHELASAVGNAAREFPIGERDASVAFHVAGIKAAAAFRQSLGNGTILSDDAHSYAIVIDRIADQPPPFAPRCINVVPVQHPGDALHYLEKYDIAVEAFAASEPREDVIEKAIESGAVRLTRFGELQKPPASGHHGGRPQIADFIRWIDREL